MTLQELFTAVTPYLTKSYVKDVQTAMRVLANALGFKNPSACGPQAYLRPIPELMQDLEVYFKTQEAAKPDKPPSVYTRRNIRHNTRILFRKAEDLGLIEKRELPPPRRRRELRAALIAAGAFTRYHPIRYGLSLEQWPPLVRRDFEAYMAKRGTTIKQVTARNIRGQLEDFVGFLLNVRKNRRVRRWDDLFEVKHLRDYVQWQAELYGVRVTTRAWNLVKWVSSIARFEEHPNHAVIRAYFRQLPRPQLLHDPRVYWAELTDLEATGLALLDHATRPPTPQYNWRIERPGLMQTLRFQRSLILRLMARLPMRSRNFLELKLGRNLFRDGDGHWQLYYAGDELKIAERRNQTNTYRPPFPVDLVPQLEDFLRDHRPKLPNAETRPELFLTRSGRPFRSEHFSDEVRTAVFNHTGKLFYPHLIRKVWATTMLERGVPVTTVANELNDTPETVFRRYYHTQARGHHQRAALEVQQIFLR